MLSIPFTLQIIYSGRSMRSNHSTWDPRRPLYEELKAPPVPRRHYHGSDDCYHTHPHPPGIFVFFGFIFCTNFFVANWLNDFIFFLISHINELVNFRVTLDFRYICVSSKYIC